jgi:hypothetical protein
VTSLPLEFHRDKQGAFKAVWSGEDASGHLLAQFFEAELGADAAYYQRLESEAENHRHGHAATWRTSGNSFGVTMKDKKVSLSPLFGKDQNHTYTLDVSDFLTLLHRWQCLWGEQDT